VDVFSTGWTGRASGHRTAPVPIVPHGILHFSSFSAVSYPVREVQGGAKNGASGPSYLIANILKTP